jgi:hypothetical protein
MKTSVRTILLVIVSPTFSVPARPTSPQIVSGEWRIVASISDETLRPRGWNFLDKPENISNTGTNRSVQDACDNRSVSAGCSHTVALKSDGTLWAWGWNHLGALGDGTNTNKYVPVPVGEGIKWASVSAGSAHTVALRSDGTL